VSLFFLLTVCTRCFALSQEQEQEEFFQRYPDLRTHSEIVQTAFDQLKQSGFRAKNFEEAYKAIALRAYVLLNENSARSSSADQSQQPKIPYWQVLEEYNRARSVPALKDMSLPEFAVRMNELTQSTAYDKGLSANWLERLAANVGIGQDWIVAILVVLPALVLFVIVFRVTSRSPSRGRLQDTEWRPSPEYIPSGPSLVASEHPNLVAQPAPVPAAVMPYGGFWRRLIALVIDSLIWILPAFAIGFVLGIAMYQQGIRSQSDLDVIENVVGILIWWLYFATMESSPLQGTLGKLAIGIKVTDMNGGRITFGRASGRHFAKILSAIILCIGFLIAAFTKKKQALHDILAECLVVCR
jgi:uncharacterized RDD family membrane protein YckC